MLFLGTGGDLIYVNEENKPGYYAIIPSNVRYCKELKFPERLLYGENYKFTNKRRILLC